MGVFRVGFSIYLLRCSWFSLYSQLWLGEIRESDVGVCTYVVSFGVEMELMTYDVAYSGLIESVLDHASNMGLVLQPVIVMI